MHKIWKKWKIVANRAMEFQAKIILWVVYFTILAPLGLWYKFTHDILRQKRVQTNWQNWPHQNTLESVHKM